MYVLEGGAHLIGFNDYMNQRDVSRRNGTK